MRRVVVTGIGAMTPLGNTFNESWENLLRGKSGISRIGRFDVSDLPHKYAGQVKDFQPSLTSKEILRYDLFIQYALVSAGEALKDAGLREVVESGQREDTAVFIGTSRAGISSLEKALERKRRRTSGRSVSPHLMPSTTGSMAASAVALKYGFKGECLGISNACASGSSSIGQAFRLIRDGYASLALAGGADAPVCRLCLEGYGAMGALSKRHGPEASRPFDRDRDGFVLSEGACILVLEELEHAMKRKAEIYGEIAGYAGGADAYHQTRPSAEGEAMTMRNALSDANIEHSSIGFMSGHATSTRLGDRIEAEAVRTVFGHHAPRVIISAFKSATGHMLAASGAFEAAASLTVLKNQVIPPTINIDSQDKECDLTVVRKTREAKIDYAMVNSFGFGGINAVLVMKKAGGR